MVAANNFRDYNTMARIFFSKTDYQKVMKMQGEIAIVSTVCPHYPDNGKRYTFRGSLGSGISLTAKQHLMRVPPLLDQLVNLGRSIRWYILVADLPELVESQREFFERVAGTKEEYLRRCNESAQAIQETVSGEQKFLFPSCVETFSSFYGRQLIPYLEIQEGVAENILKKAATDRDFSNRLNYFAIERSALSEKFRGRRLSDEEQKIAAAHGMSLYITHGTLLRSLFFNKNLVIINHATPNLRHFFMCDLVDGYGHLINAPKFPVGIIDENLY